MADDDNDGEEDVEGYIGPWLDSSEMLRHAIEITAEYIEDGVTLGLRSLYYQFVGRGIVSPEELAITDKKGKTVGAHRFYKRLGRVVAEARCMGDMDMDAIADESREVKDGEFTREDLDVDEAHDNAGEWVRNLDQLFVQTGKWVGQDVFLSVWVEKHGLAPVVEPLCKELGVGFLACGGYPSVSSLWEYLQKADFACNPNERTDGYTHADRLYTHERHIGTKKRAVILYFGDHDPDGFEIPRSAERRMQQIMDNHDIDVDLTVERIGLSMAQAHQYNLPPFGAKLTSARYNGYRREHGTDDAWEIDALDMRVLQALVRDNIMRFWDPVVGDLAAEAARDRRADLRERIADVDWLTSIFSGGE